MTAVGDVVFFLDTFFTERGVRYAIGGGLALAYYAEPRTTDDVDLSVGTPLDAAEEMREQLSQAGWLSEKTRTAPPAAGERFSKAGGSAHFDLFFSFDPYHVTLLERAVQHPFVNGSAQRPIRFVHPDDLIVLKLSFARAKDWVDIIAMIEDGHQPDVDYIERELVAFRGPSNHPVIARLRHLIERCRR